MLAKAVGRTVPRDNVSFQQIFGRLYGSGRPSKAANRSVSVFGPVPDRLLFGNGARCRRHPLHHLASTRLLDLLRPHIIQARGDAPLAVQLGTLSSPSRPSRMIRILCSADKCPRVAPRSLSPPAPQATGNRGFKSHFRPVVTTTRPKSSLNHNL